MKILFHDYSCKLSTEPKYLNLALVKSGVQSVLWNNPKASAYDVFDVNKPDVFVTNFKNLTNDILTYLKNNNHCDLVMNVTGATASQLSSIESVLKDMGIKCPLLFTNEIESKKVNISIKHITLYPACDIFNVSTKINIDHQVPEAIISNKFSEKVKEYTDKKDVYHLLYINDGELDKNFDARVNVASLSMLYKYYPKVTLVGDEELCLSQISFDLVLNCEDFEIKCSNPVAMHDASSVLFTESENSNLKEELKKQIKARHTPFHRASRLMQNLGNKYAFDKVETVKSQLPQLLRDL